MAIITLRLTDQEEKVLELLVRHFNQDKSKVLKDALWDMFEDLRDRELIEDFEKRLRAGKVEFVSPDDFAIALEEKKPEYLPRVDRPVRAKKTVRRKK